MLAHNALANGASSSCERVGSLLHEMHQDQLTSPRTVRRLRLREAKVQCIGSARDEELLAALVDLFVQSGKNPILQKRQRWVRRRSDIPEEGPIPNSSPKDVVGARAEALALSAQNDLASLAVKESLAATFIGVDCLMRRHKSMQPECLLPSTCKVQLLLTGRLASCRFRNCSPSSNQVVQQRSSAQGQPCVSSSLSGWSPKKANPGRLPKMLCGRVLARIPKPKMFKKLFVREFVASTGCLQGKPGDRQSGFV